MHQQASRHRRSEVYGYMRFHPAAHKGGIGNFSMYKAVTPTGGEVSYVQVCAFKAYRINYVRVLCEGTYIHSWLAEGLLITETACGPGWAWLHN